MTHRSEIGARGGPRHGDGPHHAGAGNTWRRVPGKIRGGPLRPIAGHRPIAAQCLTAESNKPATHHGTDRSGAAGGHDLHAGCGVLHVTSPVLGCCQHKTSGAAAEWGGEPLASRRRHLGGGLCAIQFQRPAQLTAAGQGSPAIRRRTGKPVEGSRGNRAAATVQRQRRTVCSSVRPIDRLNRRPAMAQTRHEQAQASEATGEFGEPTVHALCYVPQAGVCQPFLGCILGAPGAPSPSSACLKTA